MIIVLPYTATDNCSYFIPTYLFFEEVDIETAYIKCMGTIEYLKAEKKKAEEGKKDKGK